MAGFWYLTRIMLKGGGLNQELNSKNELKRETCQASWCSSNVSQTGVWGRSPQPPEAMAMPKPLDDFL